MNFIVNIIISLLFCYFYFYKRFCFIFASISFIYLHKYLYILACLPNCLFTISSLSDLLSLKYTIISFCRRGLLCLVGTLIFVLVPFLPFFF